MALILKILLFLLPFPYNYCINTDDIATKINEILNLVLASLIVEILAQNSNYSSNQAKNNFGNLLPDQLLLYLILQRVAGYMHVFFLFHVFL